MDLAIRTERLTKYYGNVPGVVDLDLDVPAGKVYGYLGPNGAGKTTTIRALLDLVHPTGGSAKVLGMDSHLNAVAIHRRIGYLASDPALHETMTAREHLRWLGKLRGGVKNDAIKEWADRFELALERPIAQLSKGNRQKVGLIQAFMHKPELVILDEPTAGLDPHSQKVFHDMVHDVRADGRTIFMSSHELDEVDRLCDWVGVLREARLVAVEEVMELRQHAMRKVAVRFEHDVPRHELAELAGVQDVDIGRNRATFHVVGDIDHVIKTLGQFRIVDMTMAPADLEEVFLRFYDGSANGESTDGD